MSDFDEIDDKRQDSGSSFSRVQGSYRQKSFLSTSLLNHGPNGNTNSQNDEHGTSFLPTQAAIFQNSWNQKNLSKGKDPLISLSGPTSPSLTPNGSFLHSRTSQSQVQLNNLILNDSALQKTYISPQSSFNPLSNSNVTAALNANMNKKHFSPKNNDNGLNDYDLEELRTGFFDPIFSNHVPLRPSMDEDETAINNNTIDGEMDHSVKPEVKPEHTHLSFLEFCLKFNTKSEIHLFKKNYHKILKFLIAYFISMVLSVIPKTRSWFASNNYIWILPIATLLHHPARSIGEQLEIAIWSIFGCALSIAWSALALYVATCTNAALKGYGGILWLSLTIALILSNWLGSLFRRTAYFSTTFNIGILFTHTAKFINHFPKQQNFHITNASRDWKILWDFGISYLFGILVSTIVCLFVFPDFGNKKIVESYIKTMDSIEKFLVLYIDPKNFSDASKIDDSKKKMIKNMNFKCTEAFREFSNQLKMSQFKEPLLRDVRNALTNIVAPLRCLPLDLNTITNQAELTSLLATLQTGEHTNQTNTSLDGKNEIKSMDEKNSALDSDSSQSIDDLSILKLKETFQKPFFELIVQIITCLDCNKEILKDSKSVSCNTLEKHSQTLQIKVRNLDKAYKRFIKSKYFSKSLLIDNDVVQIFLFLRYLRHSAIHLLHLNQTVTEMVNDKHWRIVFPTYPLSKSLRRLPTQCALDQGNGDQMKYDDTKLANDEIFEKIYNTFLSKHVFENSSSKDHVKAINRNDFNKKTTTSSRRWLFWNLYNAVFCDEMRWAWKVTSVFFFLCLPSWLPQSHHWYQEYQAFTGAIFFNILINKRNVGTWSCFNNRMFSCLVGIFWGWAANQARHFASPYVIMTFASILCVGYGHVYFSHKNSKTALTAIVAFTIIALEPLANEHTYSENKVTTATIWKSTWVTGLSLFICCSLTIPVNWVLWSLSARTQVRMASSSLISNIAKSYQYIVDVYLYRDVEDEPNVFALKYANISEIRLSQSIVAMEELLEQANNEPQYVLKFKSYYYKDLIDCCRNLIGKLIEARLSAQFFDVWDTDMDKDVTRSLLSLRRDAVSTVNYVFYILSNCFESKNKIPPYLPNPILSRKKLYDAIAQFDTVNTETRQDSLATSITSIPELDGDNTSEEFHWQEVHAIAFSSAFTGVTAELHRLANISKLILGEETKY